MKTWINWIIALLPVQDVTNLFLDWLEEQASKTSNQLDDNALKIIRTVLGKAFEQHA